VAKHLTLSVMPVLENYSAHLICRCIAVVLPESLLLPYGDLRRQNVILFPNLVIQFE
jgi:hypothetical protein